MKKSLISLITLALVLINLVLTALLMFAVLPETQKANALIEKVAGAIDLDVSVGSGEASGELAMDKIYPYSLADTLTINLKGGGDGTAHYAVIGVVLSQNKESSSFETYGSTKTDTYKDVIKDIINKTVAQFTAEELNNNVEEVQNAILERLNEKFGNDLYVSVGFSSITVQ